MDNNWDSVTAIADQFGQCVWEATSKFLELGSLLGDQVIVDIGCGTGDLARQAASRLGAGGRVVGFDQSGGMIQAAQAKSAGIANVEYQIADVANLALPEACCDVIFCRFALPCFADPAAVLSRSLVALKPGGRFAVMGIGAAEHNDFFTLLGSTGGPLLERSLELGDVNIMTHMLEGAGFENVKAKSIRALITVEDPGAYWNVVRGVLGIAQPTPPVAVTDRIRPGQRLSLELVFGLGNKRDPKAKTKLQVLTMDQMVSIARRKIRELTPYEVKRKLKRDEVIYLDVRDPDARQAKIKNSLHIPRGELEERIGTLIPNPEKTVLVYSEDGNQGALAAKQLQDLGYENVWNMYGGMVAWQADGMPVDK